MLLGEPVEGFRVPPHPKGISLAGGRVALDPINATKHAEDLFESYALDREGANWRYLLNGPFDRFADFSDWLRSLESQDDPTFFALKDKTRQKVTGIASYLRINREFGTIEVGHIHFSPLLQGTTGATEAMFLMMAWAFDNGYRRYEWKCHSYNVRSRRAAQRLGFSFEGVFRQAVISKGRNRDTAWFAIIDKEWPNLRRCWETYLAQDNFDAHGKQIVSLSSLTRPLLYKRDTMECSFPLA